MTRPTQYLYKIGTSQAGLTLLSALTVPVRMPKSTFQPYSQLLDLGSGKTRGAGWKMAEWVFAGLTNVERDSLRTFCTGASTDIFIRTRVNEQTDEYHDFSGVMIWPEEEKDLTGYRKDFTIKFRALVQLTDLA